MRFLQILISTIYNIQIINKNLAIYNDVLGTRAKQVLLFAKQNKSIRGRQVYDLTDMRNLKNKTERVIGKERKK